MRHRILGAIVITLLILAGCDGTTQSYEALLGEWEYADQSHISVMHDESTDTIFLDIRWQEGSVEYFAMVAGSHWTAKGLSSSYTYSRTDQENEGSTFYWGDDDDEPALAVTLVLTVKENKLKVVCEKDPPLGGKTFAWGSRVN